MLPEYVPGARNAIHACMGVTGRDRVAIVETRSRAEIAQALAEEAGAAGAEVRRWVLEDLVQRPALAFPRGFADGVTAFAPTVSFYVGEGQPGELAFRQPLLELLVEHLRCRHGHMIGIDRTVMLEGMAADYEEIFRVTNRVYEVVRQASRIEVATALGTELVAGFDPGRRWIPCHGRYHEQGQWGNLPEGETFTAPWKLDGLLVGESMGDHFSERYGLFEEPVRLRIKDSRVVSVEAHTPELRSEIESYFGQHPMSNRAGEFAIGTNIGLTRIVGTFTQDEKFPGVHVAFGDPYGSETGADWSCPSHVDVLASHADVVVDGRQIMAGGRFLI